MISELEIQPEAKRLPLWKSCLEKMRADGLTYGSQWEVGFFERELKCERGTKEFELQMLEIKHWIEHGIEAENDFDKYYFQQTANGSVWRIPTAPENEEVSRGWERRINRLAGKAVTLRAATLSNPQAQLTTDERNKMNQSLNKASIRVLMLHRQTSIQNLLKTVKPALIEKV